MKLSSSVLGLLLAVASGASANETDRAPGGATAPEACRTRLDASLVAMEERPLLKEELATGLMWMRLAAEEALATGDAEQCQQHISRVETLLGLEAPEARR